MTPDPFAPEDRPPCIAVSGVRPLGPLSGSGSWKSSESSVASLKSSVVAEGDGGFVANMQVSYYVMYSILVNSTSLFCL